MLLGNHRDAWIFGAADASSGTAVLMEVAKQLGEMKGKGTYLLKESLSPMLLLNKSRVVYAHHSIVLYGHKNT